MQVVQFDFLLLVPNILWGIQVFLQESFMSPISLMYQAFRDPSQATELHPHFPLHRLLLPHD
jgi:hypothetical protein